jgi:AcrR family transcriptional regulator
MSKKYNVKQRRIPQQKRALEKYNAVLDSCAHVLAKYGYEQSSMIELSLESNVAVSTIYQYFPDKETIYVLWFERALDQIAEQLLSLSANLEPQTIEGYILSLIEGALDLLSSYQSSMQKMLSDLPHVLSSQMLKTIENKALDMVKLLLENDQPQAAYEELEPKLQILVRCMLGYFIQKAISDDKNQNVKNEAQELAHLVNLYLNHSGAIPTN